MVYHISCIPKNEENILANENDEYRSIKIDKWEKTTYERKVAYFGQRLLGDIIQITESNLESQAESKRSRGGLRVDGTYIFYSNRRM